MQGVAAYDVGSVGGSLANVLLILINALFFGAKLVGNKDGYPKDYGPQLIKQKNPVYDFVIVGGGAAGTALANKLSEQHKWTVLLLEAGDNPQPSHDVPGFYMLTNGPLENWRYDFESDRRYCQAYTDRRCSFVRGKVLGGTSAINNMHYVRTIPQEIRTINSDIMKAIFDSVEAQGGVKLSKLGGANPAEAMLTEAYVEAGLGRRPLHSEFGFVDQFLTISEGERVNMAKSFLSPIKNRPNLFVSKNTIADSITLAESPDRRARGVNITITGIPHYVTARKELILTAGAVQNAKLLLLSGIGPKEHIESRGILPQIDLPNVGQNLQFHISVPLFVTLQSMGIEQKFHRFKHEEFLLEVFDYVISRTGGLARTGVNNFVSYLRETTSGLSYPSTAIHHVYFQRNDRYLEQYLKDLSYHPKMRSRMNEENTKFPIMVFWVTLLKPRSRGEIVLENNPKAKNVIVHGNLYHDKDDVDFTTMLDAFDYVSKLTEKFVGYKGRILDVKLNECANYKFCSLHYVRCYLRNMVRVESDVAGTAKMGADCDRSSVVKMDLEVRNVRCLRVADSSVLEQITVGNNVATDVMLGVLMSDILKRKWLKEYKSPYGD